MKSERVHLWHTTPLAARSLGTSGKHLNVFSYVSGKHLNNYFKVNLQYFNWLINRTFGCAVSGHVLRPKSLVDDVHHLSGEVQELDGQRFLHHFLLPASKMCRSIENGESSVLKTTRFNCLMLTGWLTLSPPFSVAGQKCVEI